MENLYFILSIIIFISAYALIIWDKFDRAAVAMIGAVLMILLRVINQEEAFSSIDFNTIGLLIAMMVTVMIMKKTGLFEYLAIVMVKASKANPIYIMIILALVTGLLSALLDNVTTILLILPVIISIAKDLKLDPVPFIIVSIFSSNIGGTATLIGDPPNIMIGSQTGLTFMDFLVNDAVIALPILLFTSFLFAFIYRKKLKVSESDKVKIMALNEKSFIVDSLLLKKSLVVFALVTLGFLLHGFLHYDSSTIAIAGASFLLFFSGLNSEEVLASIEWKTIIFFTGLFILVGGIDATGVIKVLANGVLQITDGNLFLTTFAILWVSAIASAFIDNIPFVATMIPMLLEMSHMTDMNITPLWWALSLGACLGGNGTVIGASANLVAIGMAEKEGYQITFGVFFKIAFPMMILTISISAVYVLIMYLL